MSLFPENLYLPRHGLWLENKMKDDTTQTIPLTLIIIEGKGHDCTSKNRGLEELLDWFHDHYALTLSLPQWDICMTTPFDYKYQNPWGFACLTLIRVTVIFTLLGIQNSNKTRKTNWIAVVRVKWHHPESCHKSILVQRLWISVF